MQLMINPRAATGAIPGLNSASHCSLQQAAHVQGLSSLETFQAYGAGAQHAISDIGVAVCAAAIGDWEPKASFTS